MADVQITREVRPEKDVIPELDTSRLQLSDTEWQFLYSAIPGDQDEIKWKILEIQREAYSQWPYPCIHGFHFVCLMMRRNEIYPRVIEAAKGGDTIFLDIGCMMGSDVRCLVQDGYPASNVLATDLHQEYINLGHKLYEDANSCNIRFFASDILELSLDSPSLTSAVALSDVTNLAQLRNRLVHVYTGALFHLFDEPTQYAMALRVALLLKRDTGAIIFGRHQGREEEGLIPDHMSRVRYGHSPESWKKLWKRVFGNLEGEDFAQNRVEQSQHEEENNVFII
ncbi:hypothetical protein PUNSTDRAFT_125638 [Punctularia strigosozonata HHB-11173 SS5]|uniref:uncharacterized protein n=1 Tax=Punctularia strigosozonata (strain HHB-11173) TaxID=741275 RepID=UPI00044169A7|nr:uncharacterized protein PUNSTDRAFT_125638 [Punctularia strigosozonata HHB-11173 SS5]EIN11105.1 hypothetical protein PUNSTDRAFT_125638 [Punctularia strigosozonata HHB-11173 SS5]